MKKTLILLSLLSLMPAAGAANLSNDLIFYASYMYADEWSYRCINETGKSFNACMYLYYNYAKPRSIKMQEQVARAMQDRINAQKRAEQLELENLRKKAIEKERKIEQRITYIVNMLDKELVEGN